MTQVVGKGSRREIETGVEGIQAGRVTVCAHDDQVEERIGAGQEGAWRLDMPAHATGVAGPCAEAPVNPAEHGG